MKLQIPLAWKFLLAILILPVFSQTTQAQCTGNANTGSTAAPAPGNTVTLTATLRAGRYTTVTGVAANAQYQATSSRTTDFLTVRRGSYNGAVVASGTQPLDWTSTTTGTYYIHCHTNSSCGTQNTNRTIRLYAYPMPMTYSSSTTVQASTDTVQQCPLNNKAILRVQVVTTGSAGTLDATQFNLRTNGSTNPLGDIANIKVYYTGTSSTFNTGTLFGSATPAAAGTTIPVNGNQSLTTGSNYFWVAYDLTATSTLNHVLDGQCLSIVVDGTSRTPSQTNPVGSRTIHRCPPNPGGVGNNILLWLKPDAGVTTSGVNVTQWEDQSTAGTTTTVAGSPDLVTVGRNYNPVIKFTKSSGQGGDYIKLPELEVRSFFLAAQLEDLTRNCTHIVTWDRVTYADPCTGCAIHGGRDQTGAPATYGEIGYGRENFQQTGVWRKNGDADGVTYNTNHSGNFDLVTALGTGIGDVNSALGGQVNNTSGFNGRLRDWLGPVGELILYRGAINAAQANRIESYLAIKYGVTLGGNGSTTLAYRSSANTLLWPANSGYHNDVIGIGRDHASDLYQRQSRTPDDSTRIFVGNLAASNQTNTGTITNDNAFVMIGHDEGRLCATHQSQLEQPSGVFSRLEREWKVTNRNFNDAFSFSVLINDCAIPMQVDPDDLRLLVDTDGNFSNAVVHDSSHGLSFTYNAGWITVSGISNTQIPIGGNRWITIASANPVTPLPIELVAFRAECIKGQVDLQWTTASEKDNAFFSVEHSVDGVMFNVIATIPGAINSSSTRIYGWSDPRPVRGTNYYRLKQTDLNGDHTYSDVVATHCSNGPGIVMYPNPAMNEFFFREPGDLGRTNLYVEIRNATGQLVQSHDFTGSENPAGIFRVPLNQLAKGLYFVQFRYATSLQTERLTILR